MSTHKEHIEYLRINYINAKNQYFNYINTYKQTFWHNIFTKIKDKSIKYNLRILFKISKYFKKSLKNNNVNKKRQKIEKKEKIETQENIVNNQNNNNETKKDIKKNEICNNQIDDITKEIIKQAKKNMYLKTDNPWCAFKNAIAEIFVELSVEFNKISDLKIITIQSRKIQTINKLLDLYKENYASYKSLFSTQKELSKDLLINMHNHPLISCFINSFNSEEIRNKFIPLVNNVIST